MDYKDIPSHLLHHISVSEELYNSLDEAIRNIVIENATLKWKRDSALPPGSIVHIHQQEPNYENYSFMLNFMYRVDVFNSTMGILDYDYSRKSTMNINNYDFIRLVQEAAHRIGATNATLTFIDSNDILHYVS